MEDPLKNIPEDILIKMYSTMLRIRMFEEKIVELYPGQEMKCPVHLCIGQEAVPAGVCANLHVRDYVFSNHRGHGHCIAKGSGFKPIMAELYGKSTGCSKGKGGSMHLIDTENGIMGTSAIVGGGIPLGVGAALASSMRREDRVTVIFFGDGAYDEGAFYESFNFASLKKLPVVFVCENNFYATNSPQSARQPVCRISDVARAFNAHGVCVDGNDAAAVYTASKEAVEKAGSNGGPTLIEAATYRWKGHVGTEEDFEKGFRAAQELLYWKERCPVRGFAERLIGSDIISRRDMDELARGIETELEEAVDYAKASPYPTESELLSDVYAGNG